MTLQFSIRAMIKSGLEVVARRFRRNREVRSDLLPFGEGPMDPYWFRQLKKDRARAARKRPRTAYSEIWDADE